MSDPSSTQAAQALPFLVKLGLAKPCTACQSERALVKQLGKIRPPVGLVAAEVYLGENEEKRYEARVWGDLTVHCQECHDTLVVPTDNGWRLLGFVKRFVEDASGTDLDRTEEIPF